MYGFGRSFEEISIRKIEAGIRAIKNETKTPKEANCNFFLDKLKLQNDGMHQELSKKYAKAVSDYNMKKEYKQ